MAYTDQTRDNLALREIIRNGEGRVAEFGQAALPLDLGGHVLKFAVKKHSSATPKAFIRVVDSGLDSSLAQVSVGLGTESITTSGTTTFDFTNLQSWTSDNDEYIWYSMDFTLAAPVGEWTLEVQTTATTQAVPVLIEGLELVSSETADGSITRADIADPDGLQTMRWAASGHRAADDEGYWFNATVSNFGAVVSLGVTAATTTAPGAGVNLWGNNATGQPNIRVEANGSVELQLGSVLLATTALDFFQFDGTPYKIEATIDATSYTFTINGALIASGTHGETPVAITTIELGSLSSGSFTWTGALWDAYLYDAVDANTRIFLRLDEDGGPYWNAYLKPDDPLYNASNDSGFTLNESENASGIRRVLVPTLDYANRGLTDDDLASLALRPAAKFDGTGGGYGRTSWAPTTQDFVFEFWCMIDPGSSGTDYILGGSSASNINVARASTAGAMSLTVAASVVTTTNILPADGRPHFVRVERIDGVANFYVDGRLLYTEAEATTCPVVAFNVDLGTAAGSSSALHGNLWGVRLIDPASDSNSAHYKLDEVTGNYVDSLGNLADATRNGYVGSVAVQSVEGDAKPVHAQPLVVAGWERDDTSESLDGSVASAHILTSTDRSDPFGLLSDSTATAPFDGYVIVHGTVGVTGSDGTDEFSVWAQKNSSNETKMLVWTPGTSIDQRPANAMFAVNKGDTVRITAASIAAGNTGLQHRNSNVTYAFLRSN